ncbi:MAG: hypothetical protein JOZ73_04350 [Solirubrobacterales bacterium]|nr:hypothetical protein [Solirubrobacterales bacterium]
MMVASVVSFLLLASFVLFAHDQLAGASKHQQNEIVGAAQASSQPTPARTAGQPRRFIDSAAKTLTSPFSSMVQSDSPWVTKGLPTLIALIVYGLGIGYLARYARGLA